MRHCFISFLLAPLARLHFFCFSLSILFSPCSSRRAIFTPWFPYSPHEDNTLQVHMRTIFTFVDASIAQTIDIVWTHSNAKPSDSFAALGRIDLYPALEETRQTNDISIIDDMSCNIRGKRSRTSFASLFVSVYQRPFATPPMLSFMRSFIYRVRQEKRWNARRESDRLEWPDHWQRLLNRRSMRIESGVQSECSIRLSCVYGAHSCRRKESWWNEDSNTELPLNTKGIGGRR